jgi:hypothetical protein
VHGGIGQRAVDARRDACARVQTEAVDRRIVQRDETDVAVDPISCGDGSPL